MNNKEITIKLPTFKLSKTTILVLKTVGLLLFSYIAMKNVGIQPTEKLKDYMSIWWFFASLITGTIGSCSLVGFIFPNKDK